MGKSLDFLVAINCDSFQDNRTTMTAIVKGKRSDEKIFQASCLIRLTDVFLLYTFPFQLSNKVDRLRRKTKIMKTISFIIPLYNEEKRIEKTFKALKELQLDDGLKLEKVIFVNDGSNDNSKFKIQNSKLQIENKLKTKVQIISYRKNRGKGYAIKQGMKASNSDYTLFFDADISTPLSEINKFLPFIDKGTDVIIGTRKNGKSTVVKHQPVYRELLGRGFTLISNIILGTSYTDFTCGFKAFKKEAKDAIFKKSMISRWGYDSEILFLAKKLGFLTKEVPVVWANEENSKVNVFLDAPRSLAELFLIRFFNLEILGFEAILERPMKFLKYTYLNL